MYFIKKCTRHSAYSGSTARSYITVRHRFNSKTCSLVALNRRGAQINTADSRGVWPGFPL
eukprot:2978060-Pleurochrysis_carterae.AAC.1